MEYLKQFLTHIENNHLPSLAMLWQEYCLSDEIDAKELKNILIKIKDSTLAEPFGFYVCQILMLWETLPESEIKDEIISLIFDLQTTNEEDQRAFCLKYLENRYGKEKNFQYNIKLIGLKEKESFQYVISNYRLLSHMSVGNFFIHTGGWGVGEVMEVSSLREQITMEFDYVAGFKEISFANAFKTLIPVPNTHFLARRFGDPENFEKFARKYPVETVRMMLGDLGPKSAQEIKDEVCELIIPEADWPKWWNSVRGKLKKDTYIEVPTEAKGNFKLREKEVSHEERLEKALRAKPEANALIEMIYGFLRDFSTVAKNVEFSEFLKVQLIDVLSHREITDSQEIQILFILQDLGHEKAGNLKDIILNVMNIESVIAGIHVLFYKKKFLTQVRKFREDWASIFASLLYTIDQNPLRDYMLDELMEQENLKLVEGKIETLLDAPNLSPSAFLWYFQKILSSDQYPFSDSDGKNRFFESFFILLYYLETKGTNKELIKKMHTFLSSGRFANVRSIFQNASEEVIKEMLLIASKCSTLSDHDLKILYSLAEVVHPSLGKLKKESNEDEENCIWTTSEGFQKIKDRIEKIATVETVENAKEIEIARAHGDLRENSEFKFAMEKRSRLQGEIKFLSEQIKKMRILTTQDIDTSVVMVGTKVELKSANGETTSYTLLGPWDADPENNILSFQSKLAKDLIGKKVGSSCEVHNEPWTVTNIMLAI